MVVLVIGISLLIGIAVYTRRSRRSGFGAAAGRMGLGAFEGTIPFGTDDRKGFNLFSRGYAGTWTNMLADNPEVPSTLLFDFSYRFGLRIIASVGYSQTVAAFSARLTGLPDFQLAPATSLERIAPKLGAHGIQFESRPEFGKKYWLRTNNEISVRAIFSDAFIDRFFSVDPKAEWYVEKSGQWLLVYRHGVLFAPQDLPAFGYASRAIANLFFEPH
jgi:hypothetical protein